MRQMIKLVVSFMITAILVVAGNVTTFADQKIEEPRTVKVGVGFSNAMYLDESGRPQGYCAHYIRQIAWLENWDLQYVEVTWPEALEKMRKGELDLLFPVQMSDERKEFLDYSDYSGGFESVGIYAKSNSNISFNEYEALDGKCIGVEKNNMCSQDLDSFAKEHKLTYSIKEFDSDSEMNEALDKGDIELLVSSTMNNVSNSTLVAILDFMPFYYCTPTGKTELMHELNDGMKKIMTDNPSMALDVIESTMKGTAVVGYTKEENEVIANTDKIIFGMYDNCLPISGTDEDGNPIGIYVDLLKQLQEITGIKMEPYIVSTDDFIFDYLDDGTVDYIMCSNRLPYVNKDVSKYLGSDPIVDYTTVGITREEYDFDETKSMVIALTIRRNYLESYIESTYPNATIKYYSSAKECMAAVQAKKADLTFINSWEYNYESKNARFRRMKQWENTRISSSVIVVTSASKDASWLNIVDKAFHKMSTEEKEEIIAQNINMTYASYNVEDKIYEVWNSIKVAILFSIIIVFIFGLYLYMRRKSVKVLMSKNQELEDANAAKSAFLSRMSHELRTPLNAISGFTQEQESNCKSNEFDVETEIESIAAVQHAVRYQLAIIGDLLNMHQIESGKIQLVMEEIDATAFMKDIIEMIRPEAQSNEIEFSYNRLTRTNETYLVDPIRVQQVVFNLLHNAIKFTPKGGKVTFSAEAIEQENNMVRLKFVISDTGIGMSKDFVENKLFQKFAQEYSGNTSPYDGCGIGLSTCKELVELMGGTITCESEQGKGSTFTVEITAQALKKQRRKRREKEAIPCDLDGIHILLCEDNEMNQDVEKKILKRMGCKVDVAENGQLGCDMFSQSEIGTYSMILMDIRMPQMDGLEATKSIRAMSRDDAKTVPIIAVSANAFEEDIRKSLEAGMNEHLSKPMDARIIHEKIIQYCVQK